MVNKWPKLKTEMINHRCVNLTVGSSLLLSDYVYTSNIKLIDYFYFKHFMSENKLKYYSVYVKEFLKNAK